MTIRLSSILLLIFLLSIDGKGQNVQKIVPAEYMSVLAAHESELKIVNFWATWCAPCITELKNFTKIGLDYDSKKIKILLISMDDQKAITRIQQVLKKNNFPDNSYLLIAEDSELRQIYQDWSGAVPLTLIYDKNNQLIRSYEKQIDFETLQKLIQ